jgi:hypothetical protein
VLLPRGKTVAVLIPLLAISAAMAVPAQAPAAGTHASRTVEFGGRTSQCPQAAGRCGQVGFLMLRNLSKVTRFQIEYAATCQSNPSDPILDGVGTTTLPTSSVGKSRYFTANGEYDLDNDPVTGNKRHATVTFGARVGMHGHAKGTLQVTIAITNAAGEQVDTCSTGTKPVTWSAKLLKS